MDIIEADLITIDDNLILWDCDLEVDSLEIKATAPGDLQKGQLQAYFDSKLPELQRVAARKGKPVDVFGAKRISQALALVIMDEINILREIAGLPLRNVAQIKAAIREKLLN